jgi:hypothetical protein
MLVQERVVIINQSDKPIKKLKFLLLLIMLWTTSINQPLTCQLHLNMYLFKTLSINNKKKEEKKNMVFGRT